MDLNCFNPMCGHEQFLVRSFMNEDSSLLPDFILMLVHFKKFEKKRLIQFKLSSSMPDPCQNITDSSDKTFLLSHDALDQCKRIETIHGNFIKIIYNHFDVEGTELSFTEAYIHQLPIYNVVRDPPKNADYYFHVLFIKFHKTET